MIKSFLPVILILTFLSCAKHPQALRPIENRVQRELVTKCPDIFLPGSWQLVHTIYASSPDGKTNAMTGVTIIDDNPPTIKCVLMTLEGFVLFDGTFDKKLVINRGAPPFDSIGFAHGLIDDIRLIFFKPEGVLAETGLLKEGHPTCRFQNHQRQITDIIFFQNNTWQIRQYNKNKLSRTVTVSFRKIIPNIPPFIPDKIILTAHGILGYELSMNLVEAVRLTP